MGKSAGRELAWQKIKDKILALVDESQNGITARDVTRNVYEFRSSRLSSDPRESLK